MMRPFRRVRRDEEGSYLVEFAFLFLPMMTLLLGGVELAYLSYVDTRTEGVLREVSRLSATGFFLTEEATEDGDDETEGGEEDEDTAPTSLEKIAKYVAGRLNEIPGADFDVDVRSYDEFEDIGNPEPISSDVAPLGGEPGPGDCFIDVTNDGEWTADIPGTVGVGGAEDIVYFGLEVAYEPLFSLTKSFAGDELTINVNAAIKNEPFANASSSARPEVCIPLEDS